MKILFVENHARFAVITVKAFLSSHEVEVVPNMALAREALLANRFDAVLIDYDLDDGKGAELIADIQKQASRPIIIAVSSHAAGNDILLQAGADAVCSKMQFKDIEDVIAQAVTSTNARPHTPRNDK